MTSGNRKIFGIGLSRTGTTSLAAALELLGYRTLHYSLPVFAQQQSVFPERTFTPQSTVGWQERFVLKKEIKATCQQNTASVFHAYDAFCDLPFPLFVEELDRQYPNSKFILTTRPLEAWLKSMQWMLEKGPHLWGWGYLDKELLMAVYGTYTYDAQKLTLAWHRHHAHARTYFQNRPDDLLEMDLAEGDFTFERLCPFLGIDHPKVDFPKSNEARKPAQEKKINWADKYLPAVCWALRRAKTKLLRLNEKA